MRWAGGVGGEGGWRRVGGLDSEQRSSRVEGGKRGDTSLLEGSGVCAGPGRAGPSSAAQTRHTQQRSRLSASSGATPHITREGESDCNGGEGGTSSTATTWARAADRGDRHVPHVACSKSPSAGSPEAEDGCLARQDCLTLLQCLTGTRGPALLVVTAF